MARIFIGIDLPPESRSALRQVQEAWRNQDRGGLGQSGKVAWVAAETCHLTLRFLGEIDEASLKRVVAECESSIAGIGPFQLSLGPVGFLPTPRQPRVIMVGLGGDLSALTELWQQIERATRWLERQSERREFHPHITLGRFRRKVTIPWRLSSVGELAVPPHDFVVSTIEVKESFRRPEGARHLRRASIPLRGG